MPQSPGRGRGASPRAPPAMCGPPPVADWGDGGGGVGRGGVVASVAPLGVACVVSRLCLLGVVVAAVGARPAVGSGGGTAAAVGGTAAAATAADDPAPPASAPLGCARRLFTHPGDFAPCAAGVTCFLFLHEEPFARDNPHAAVVAASGTDRHDIRIPFPCVNAGLHGQDGLAWALYDELVADPTDLCAFGGNESECSFNGLLKVLQDSRDAADHPGFGMGLALHGAWVFSEERAYLASASDAFMEVWWVVCQIVGGTGLPTTSSSKRKKQCARVRGGGEPDTTRLAAPSLRWVGDSLGLRFLGLTRLVVFFAVVGAAVFPR